MGFQWKTGPMDDELGVSKLGKISTSMNLKPGEKVQPVLLISIFFSTRTSPTEIINGFWVKVSRNKRGIIHISWRPSTVETSPWFPVTPLMIWTSKFLELWVSRASISPNKNTTKNHQLRNERENHWNTWIFSLMWILFGDFRRGLADWDYQPGNWTSFITPKKGRFGG